MNTGKCTEIDVNIDSALKVIVSKVHDSGTISREDALKLLEVDLQRLCSSADQIRKDFCGDGFDLCSIVNGKSGRCSENCKYCAQSAFYQTNVEQYPLMAEDKMIEQGRYNHERGVGRFSIVTSGKRLSDSDVEVLCKTVKRIVSEVGIKVCISGGLLSEANFKKLHDAGATRVHNNLETSENFFPSICTTHTYQDKIDAIQAARRAGMEVCSGGIIGLGESWEDRIDLALRLRELEIQSIPVNVLNPIEGTPLENNRILTEDEVRRALAIFRFINPQASIRMAGGRGCMSDSGRMCFMSGANAAITGDMLTTSGITIARDMEILKELGYEPFFSASQY